MAPIPKGVNKVGILTALGSAGLLVFAFLALSSGVNGSKYGANLFSLSDLLIGALGAASCFLAWIVF